MASCCKEPSTIRWRPLSAAFRGHAGLFGTARDLADIVANESLERVITPENVFTSKPPCLSSRAFTTSRTTADWAGIKPRPTETVRTYRPRLSVNSFGHTGFTGTMIWVDPEEDLVFVFLVKPRQPGCGKYGHYYPTDPKKNQDVVYSSLIQRKSQLP